MGKKCLWPGLNLADDKLVFFAKILRENATINELARGEVRGSGSDPNPNGSL